MLNMTVAVMEPPKMRMVEMMAQIQVRKLPQREQTANMPKTMVRTRAQRPAK